MIHRRLRQTDDLLGEMLVGAERYRSDELQMLVRVTPRGDAAGGREVQIRRTADSGRETLWGHVTGPH